MSAAPGTVPRSLLILTHRPGVFTFTVGRPAHSGAVRADLELADASRCRRREAFSSGWIIRPIDAWDQATLESCRRQVYTCPRLSARLRSPFEIDRASTNVRRNRHHRLAVIIIYEGDVCLTD